MPFVVPVKAMALTVSTLMCGTMFTTYYFCVHDSECPALPKLPTISNTWEDPPGNFLSRVVVSIVALLMALLQPTLFLPAKGKLWCNGTVNLVLGVISCLLLSVVGAVCDSESDPECEGQSQIHVFSAVGFFIIYNLNSITNLKISLHPYNTTWQQRSSCF